MNAKVSIKKGFRHQNCLILDAPDHVPGWNQLLGDGPLHYSSKVISNSQGDNDAEYPEQRLCELARMWNINHRGKPLISATYLGVTRYGSIYG
jgi:hypothetical protein